MRILITGAAGRIGRATRKTLAAAGHVLRLTDLKPIADAEDESFPLDVTDGDAVLQAVAGMDAVVHLAYGADHQDKTAADIRSHFDVNVRGTYFLLWAAARHQVKRFVYTSSLSVFGGPAELARGRWDEASPVNLRSPYGLTKRFGEEVCEFFARNRGLNIVCLRLCGVADAEQWEWWKQYTPAQHQQTGRPPELYAFYRGLRTHVDDAARAIRLAVESDLPGYELFHIAADNKDRVTEIERARQVLGFRPEHRIDDP
ncbi:NAD(P)-dependent oxidoreductase [bacterium]|nr:NAD(P)-dependent oxidoreductase [bacterium]